MTTNYLSQGTAGSLSTFGDQILDEDISEFIASCEAAGAVVVRGEHAGRQTIQATIEDGACFMAIIVLGCKSQGDFYRAAKSAGVI